MIRIEEPIYFYLMLIVPLVALLFYGYYRYGDRLHKWFSSSKIERDIRQKNIIRNAILYSVGVALIGLAMTNPQYGYRKEKVDRESADVFIALDISKSMLAEDLSPSRLERAKKIAERLIDALKSERIGLILFAGESYLQMPLTTDYRTAMVFVRNASTDQAGVQGTAIADAITMASQRDEEDTAAPRGRMLIILTDGEDHEGEAAIKAQEAYETGTAVFTVGIGTDEGSFIPTKINGQNDYLRDKSGQPVRSKINTADLKQIAQQGGGLYFDYQVGSDMYKNIKDKVKRMERRHYEKSLFTARESYFQWLLFPALLLLMLPTVLDHVFRKVSA